MNAGQRLLFCYGSDYSNYVFFFRLLYSLSSPKAERRSDGDCAFPLSVTFESPARGSAERTNTEEEDE